MSGLASMFELDITTDPPHCVPAEDEVEITVGLTVKPQRPVSQRLPLVLAIVPVCPRGDHTLGPQIGEAVTQVIDRLGDEDVILGAPDLQLTVDSPAETLVWGSPKSSLTEGLEAAEAMLRSFAGVPVARRVLLVVNGLTHESGEALTRIANVFSQDHIGVDVLITALTGDLGLLSRLANLGGGAMMIATEPEQIAARISDRLPVLQSQWALNSQLEIVFPQAVKPVEMFRLAPTRSYLGAIRVGHTERRLMLDPGPLGAEGAPRFLLTLMAPRRAVGQIRLCTARLEWTHMGLAEHVISDVILRCQPIADPQVRVELIAIRDQMSLLSWAEEMGRAQGDGEHRRVSNLLERTARRLNELGFISGAEHLGDLRRGYLRTGSLSMIELNQIRHLLLGL